MHEWPAIRKTRILYRATSGEAEDDDLKEYIIIHKLNIQPSDPKFQELMQMDFGELLQFVVPVEPPPPKRQKEAGASSSGSSSREQEDQDPCTFYLMTTAMNYIEEGSTRIKRMTDHWPRIRDNIVNCIKSFNANAQVCIIHFVVHDPGRAAQDWRWRLQGEQNKVYENGFPQSEAEMENLGIRLNPQNHVLVDMANLIRYAQDDYFSVGFYEGYDRAFISTINHTYLHYDNFVRGIEKNTGPLIRFQEGILYKACFDRTTLSIDREQYSKSLPHTLGNCKGLCGFNATTGNDYCSVCLKLKQSGQSPELCTVCGKNQRKLGHERCETCLERDVYRPPTILDWVPAIQICKDNL